MRWRRRRRIQSPRIVALDAITLLALLEDSNSKRCGGVERVQEEVARGGGVVRGRIERAKQDVQVRLAGPLVSSRYASS